MQTIIGKTPFRILGAHGVPKQQVAVLEKRFGPIIPGDVLGPDDVLGWALSILPWERVARILAFWVLRGATRAGIQADRRVQAVLHALQGAKEEVEKAQSVLEQLMMTFARVRGVDATADENMARDDLDDEFRAWVAAYGAASAALVALDGPLFEDTGTGVTLALSTLRWVISQDSPEVRPYTYDEVIQFTAGELAEYVSTWTKAAQA